ncbi:hypothetical protein D3Y57_12710 [Sphingomonas paeninsulae]|uniref:DUF2946 domain-containing protein n=1 Tax=Sphingomonas paeninsulae TaxID=2319844 RepID=A0A494TMK6_SPHPE|nr:hypothetical protein [Sphingomonas paeninsulae]AYJ86668.1 hypothetical protein D3Y57_12710 [Sphingomonas paeninsulae]
MNALRSWILAQRKLAFVLVAVVLFAKMFVPTGYMFTPTTGGFVVQMCSGQGATPILVHIGEQAPVEDHSGPGKMDAPCAFSGIGMMAMAAVDLSLLIVAIAFILALGTVSTRAPIVRALARLRPPLRAPPIFS